ncbi:MAG: phosphatidylserine/phosphatidylglycerophosphate/cardiolipin synthase family protein [Bdellovibrio sp.]|nr:phosphatidylserine/phosphatidylglycerophosphate/cardiolipin synthase family protein [Bdellovibrio sp.]
MSFFKTILLPILFVGSASFADKIKLLDNNDNALQARVDLIANAKREILVEYFAFASDDFSLTSFALLREAAERGVKIKILMDSLNNKLSQAEMAAILGVTENSKAFENIEVRLFNPLRGLNIVHQTYRNHDKLLNIDGEYMIVGGRNAAESYFGKSKVLNFKDADALVSGKSAEESRDYFLTLWNKNPEVRKLELYNYSQVRVDYPNCASAEESQTCGKPEQEIKASLTRIKSLYQQFKAGKSWVKTMPLAVMLADMEEVGPIKFAFNDPTQTMSNVEEKLASQILSTIVENARESIVISTPYLYPTDNELASLRVLAARGVNIKIVTNSLASTDSTLVHAALLSIKKQLADIGIELYLYKGPDVLHAKGAIIDGKISFIGSFNFDQRSAEINREIGIKVGENSAKASQFSKHFNAFIQNELIANSVLATKDGREIDLIAFDSNVSMQKKAMLDHAKPFISMLKNQL